jgi:hypothetical protein
MSTSPYSYHTFLFPFIWNDEINGDNNIDEILENHSMWKEQKWSERWSNGIYDPNKPEWLLDYARYQYFTEPARNLILGVKNSENEIVRHFEYMNSKSGKYIIAKDNAEYHLNINNIRLNIYKRLGIGIMIFELEYHIGNKKIGNVWDFTKSIDDITKINEYGRRINFPYLVPGASHELTADKITININNQNFCEDYLQLSQKLDVQTLLM